MRLIESLIRRLCRPPKRQRPKPPSSPQFKEATPEQYGGGLVIATAPPRAKDDAER